MTTEYQVTADIINEALAQACAKGGFCTYLDGKSLLKKYQNNVTPEHFATAVLYAEGLETKYSSHRKHLENIFIKCIENSNNSFAP